MPAETVVKEYDLIYVKYEEEYLEQLARANT